MYELLIDSKFSSPFIEERLYLENLVNEVQKVLEFSSPFIEERLYFHDNAKYCSMCGKFSSPFIEERLYFFIYTTTFFDKG